MMKKNKKSVLRIRYVSLLQWVMWHFFSRNLNLILVGEYPKSGATWFCKMLSSAANLPYPNNFEIPKFESSILHGVFFYRKKFHKTICILRDGRDVMVSSYYFFLFENDKNSFGVKRYRELMPFDDYDNIKENLPAFIEFMFTKYRVRGRVATWANFNRTYYDDPNVLIIKYENLLTDSVTELKKALAFNDLPPRSDEYLKMVADSFSFESMSKRKPGVENHRSFLRKGIAGDWKNKFSHEACKTFDKYAGDLLIQFQYEKDHNWY